LFGVNPRVNNIETELKVNNENIETSNDPIDNNESKVNSGPYVNNESSASNEPISNQLELVQCYVV